MLLPLILVGALSSPSLAAAPAPADFAALRLPAALSKDRVRALLQDFVADGYGRRFRHLGEERDFDHGHVLLDARTRAPVAILYHTQELAADSEGLLDPDGRNWVQWLDGRGTVNARAYERAAYPRGGDWDWFVARDLPKYRGRHTIVEKMLDPALLGADTVPGPQVTFTRAECAGAPADAASNVINVSLPGGAPVCLALSALE